MYAIDYHLHSRHSFDGQETVADICRAAIARGRQEIAITDHLDIFSDRPFEATLDVSACFAEIEAARAEFEGRLVIKTGVELGQPQANRADAARFFAMYSPDFVIGSVHNMENDVDLYDYDWSKEDEFKVYGHYLDWLMDLAENDDFDVMGHLTYPLRYVFEARGVPFPLERYRDRFAEIFGVLVRRGKGIECNTSGFNQKIGESLPPLELLRLFRDCGGEIVTVGSDAHRLEHVSATVPLGEELLRQAGFRYIATFTRRQTEFHAL